MKKLTVREYADLRRVSKDYVKRMCKEGTASKLAGVVKCTKQKALNRFGIAYMLIMTHDYVTAIETARISRADHNGKISAACKNRAEKNSK